MANKPGVVDTGAIKRRFCAFPCKQGVSLEKHPKCGAEAVFMKKNTHINFLRMAVCAVFAAFVLEACDKPFLQETAGGEPEASKTANLEPEVPQGVSLFFAGNASVAIRWKAAANAHHYEVALLSGSLTPENIAPWPEASVSACGDTVTANVKKLVNGEKYRLYARSVNKDGVFSGWSEPCAAEPADRAAIIVDEAEQAVAVFKDVNAAAGWLNTPEAKKTDYILAVTSDGQRLNSVKWDAGKNITFVSDGREIFLDDGASIELKSGSLVIENIAVKGGEDDFAVKVSGKDGVFAKLALGNAAVIGGSVFAGNLGEVNVSGGAEITGTFYVSGGNAAVTGKIGRIFADSGAVRTVGDVFAAGGTVITGSAKYFVNQVHSGFVDFNGESLVFDAPQASIKDGKIILGDGKKIEINAFLSEDTAGVIETAYNLPPLDGFSKILAGPEGSGFVEAASGKFVISAASPGYMPFHYIDSYGFVRGLFASGGEALFVQEEGRFYEIHRFVFSGKTKNLIFERMPEPPSAWILVAGGGGKGGKSVVNLPAGGGGAGGLQEEFNFNVRRKVYKLKVGGGGASYDGNLAANGENSWFGSNDEEGGFILAYGGGGGAPKLGPDMLSGFADFGGSGGGSSTAILAAGGARPGVGGVFYGNAGGESSTLVFESGGVKAGGGGGAGTPGLWVSPAPGEFAGGGGGRESKITVERIKKGVVYAQGGPVYGGGATEAFEAPPDTGSGGAGGNNGLGSNGANGVVIVRFERPAN